MLSVNTLFGSIAPRVFDQESRLPGPAALLRAVRLDVATARKHGTSAGIAVLDVAVPSPDVIRAVAEQLRACRGHQDVAGRLSEHRFALVMGGTYKGRDSMTVSRISNVLEEVVEAAEKAGSIAVAAVFWLQQRHASAEELYEEAVKWQP